MALPKWLKLYLFVLAIVGLSRSITYLITYDPNPLPFMRTISLSPSPIVFTNKSFFIGKRISFYFKGKTVFYDIIEENQWLFFGKIFFYPIMYAHETDNRDWHRIMNYSFCENLHLAEKPELADLKLLSLDIEYIDKDGRATYRKQHQCYE